ncbi:glycosyltransferase family 4 protein [Leptospira semungkisensis]|uniref:Glycosyltransferase family 4 protein n=1 Tax=Leptospira semungkisensis TaxID=2484985 RepID=A0A4R9FLE5_9LEPT|nr:glycosyltransferase [Leptospira semungkisensis]TGJ99220.1 glycosyltransferase family 4 protein [Leptospira semungkisensis]
MKILYFSDTFLPKIDGVAISMRNFAELLAERGHEFLICCPRYGEGDFERMGERIRVERFRSGYLPSYPDIKVVLPSPSKIKKAIKEFQPDLVHIHTPGLMGVYGINATEKYGVPSIGTYHTLMSEQDMYLSFYRLLKLDKLFMRIGKLNKKIKIKDLLKFEKFDKFNIRKKIILKITNNLYDRCDLIISPSHLIKKQLEEFGLKKPVAVISNGLDLSQFKGSPKTLSENPKLLHVGRISYEKNCDVVINAFKLIVEKIPGATLTIIGDGPALPSLKLQAQKLGIERSIMFTGFIDRAELPQHYPNFDLFLTASTMETQGLVILEAVACGLPAVGVDSFAIPELVHHGENGYIAKSFDVKDIAEKAISILESPETYAKFSEESLKISKSHEMKACVDKMEEVYKSVAAQKGKKKKRSILNTIFSMDPFGILG